MNNKDSIINSPNHYTTGNLEVIDILESKLTKDQFKGFLKGNIIKYILRSDHKKNEYEDICKAKWYISRLEGFLKAKEKKHPK